MRIGKKIFYPEEFKVNYIREHPHYEDDLKKLIDKSGFRDKFCGLYKQRLRFLDEHGGLITKKRDWFERLKHADGELYAIKFKAQKNIRVLFTFIEYQQVQYAVLLYPFEEKESKKKGKMKTSYDAAIPIALERLKEVRGND